MDDSRRKTLVRALLIVGLIFAAPLLLLFSRAPDGSRLTDHVPGLNWWPKAEGTISGAEWMQRVAEEAEKARRRGDPAFQRPDLRDKDDKKR